MPDYPIVRFVVSPDAGAAVRYDFQADPNRRILSESFDDGQPQLGGSPDQQNRQWGYRRISMTHRIDGNRATAQPLVSTLATELMRPYNWLLYQHSASSIPMWYRTWMTQPGADNWDFVYNEDNKRSLWTIPILLDADPWKYGVRRGTTFTMGNDPSTGTNPTVYTLPAIVGDAPAPLRLRVTGDYRGYAALASVMASDVAPATSLIATVFSMGGDTTSVTDATAVGGSTHRVAFTGTAALAGRLTYSGPTIRHGKYKGILRVRGAGFVGRAQLIYSAAALTDTPIVGTSGWTYIDLGEFEWPPGGLINDEEFLTTSSPFNLILAMSRSAGTTLDVDALLLWPTWVETLEADTLSTTYPTSEVAGGAMFIDGSTESVRVVTSADVALGVTTAASTGGGFPFVVPGRTNVLRYLQTMTPVDSKSTTAVITASYLPRWLKQADS